MSKMLRFRDTAFLKVPISEVKLAPVARWLSLRFARNKMDFHKCNIQIHICINDFNTCKIQFQFCKIQFQLCKIEFHSHNIDLEKV